MKKQIKTNLFPIIVTIVGLSFSIFGFCYAWSLDTENEKLQRQIEIHRVNEKVLIESMSNNSKY